MQSTPDVGYRRRLSMNSALDVRHRRRVFTQATPDVRYNISKVSLCSLSRTFISGVLCSCSLHQTFATGVVLEYHGGSVQLKRRLPTWTTGWICRFLQTIFIETLTFRLDHPAYQRAMHV